MRLKFDLGVKNWLIVDYSHIAYHAFYSKAEDKDRVILLKILQAIQNANIKSDFAVIMAIDPVTENFRKMFSDTYKANRPQYETNPKELFNPLLMKLPFFISQKDSEEADDVIYSLCKKNRDKKICVATNDNDLSVLNKFKHVRVISYKNGETLNLPEDFKTEEDYFIYKAMAGDPSDNIKRIKKGLQRAKILELVKKDKATTQKAISESLGQEAAIVFYENYELVKLRHLEGVEITQGVMNMAHWIEAAPEIIFLRQFFMGGTIKQFFSE